MNNKKYSFCIGCNPQFELPKCAVGLAPSNAYIEDIINGSPLTLVENFICHKTAQVIEGNKIRILDKCDNCGLCYITCSNVTIDDYTSFFNTSLEKVILNDFGKASILFQTLFPNASVATEVQVKGNFRTKRIDLVIKKISSIYFIKLLKNTDKISFYIRSYMEVMEYYLAKYQIYHFQIIFLVPSTKINRRSPIEAKVCTITDLYKIIEGNEIDLENNRGK